MKLTNPNLKFELSLKKQKDWETSIRDEIIHLIYKIIFYLLSIVMSTSSATAIASAMPKVTLIRVSHEGRSRAIALQSGLPIEDTVALLQAVFATSQGILGFIGEVI